jgi:hypothetical protein
MSNYRPDDYLNSLDDALNRFEHKLVDRWHQTINDVVWSMDPMPPNLARYQTLGDKNLVWDHRSAEIQAHISFPNGGCAALDWYADGRPGPASAIVCDGKIRDPGDTGQLEWYGEMVDLPEYTECHIGELFADAHEWAYQDRQIIFDELPLFADQDASILETAWNALRDMGAACGLASEVTDDGVAIDSPDVAFDTDMSLPDLVDNLSAHGEGGRMKRWEIEWTGLAADHAKSGIFASTEPTLRNHALLAAYLAQMINLRATIITKYRGDNISLINGARDALDETRESEAPTNPTGLWNFVQFAGLTLSLVPGVGASKDWLKWAAFVGPEVFSRVTSRDVTFRYKPGEVTEDLYEEVRKLKQALTDNYDEFAQQVAKLRDNVNATPSTYLELYDLTENSPTGAGGPGRSFSVSISDVMSLATNSYKASEMYDQIRRRLADTDEARSHLSDQDVEPTVADREIIALLDEFEGYLTTTAARYYLTGDQIEEAARSYEEAEGLNAGQFDELNDWRADIRDFTDITPDGLGDYEGPGDPGEAAEDTDRPDDANDDIADGYETEESGAAPDTDTEKSDVGKTA